MTFSSTNGGQPTPDSETGLSASAPQGTAPESRDGQVQQAASGTRGPDTALQLTYQNFLRAIGRHLDRGRYRHSLICQVPSGFIIRGYPNGFDNVRSAEALEFTIEDLKVLVADLVVTRSPLPANEIPDSSRVPRLLPTGYEDFLRALGFECDSMGTRNVRLVETTEAVLLSYELEGSKTRHERLFDEQLIYSMLNTAFGRRRPLQRRAPDAEPATQARHDDASAMPPQPKSPLRRITKP